MKEHPIPLSERTCWNESSLSMTRKFIEYPRVLLTGVSTILSGNVNGCCLYYLSLC